jgi:[ribosomal protein S18]-alanine N-acetyltransferase
VELRRLRQADGDLLREVRLEEAREVAMGWGMWVEPGARRAGIGRVLLEAVAGGARDWGASRLRLAVIDCDASRPAAALCRKCGFVETGERESLQWNASLISRILWRSL